MGNFRISFNDTEYVEVDKLEDIDIEFDRDIKEKGFTTKYAQKLTVFGALYEYLYGLGPCENVEVLVERYCGGTWSVLAQGFVLVKDIEFNLSRCTASISIEDNSIYAIFQEAKDRDVLIPEDELSVMQNFADLSGTLLAQTDGTDYAKGISVFRCF